MYSSVSRLVHVSLIIWLISTGRPLHTVISLTNVSTVCYHTSEIKYFHVFMRLPQTLKVPWPGVPECSRNKFICHLFSASCTYMHWQKLSCNTEILNSEIIKHSWHLTCVKEQVISHPTVDPIPFQNCVKLPVTASGVRWEALELPMEKHICANIHPRMSVLILSVSLQQKQTTYFPLILTTL